MSRGEAVYKTVAANLGGPSVRHMRKLIGAGALKNGCIIDDIRSLMFERVVVLRRQNKGVKLDVEDVRGWFSS
jgi:hypothetical protein